MNHPAPLARPRFASTLILAAAALQIACGASHKEATSAPREYGGGGGGGGGGGYPTATVAADSTGGTYASESSYKGEGSVKPAAEAPAMPMPAPAPVSVPPSSGADYGSSAGAKKPSVASKSDSAPSKSYAPPPAPPPPASPPTSVAKAPPPVAPKPSPGTTTTTPPSVAAKGTTTIVIGSSPYSPGGGSVVQEAPSGGVLTAAIWDDNAMRASFLTFLDRYPTFGTQWGLDLKHRVTIKVEDSNGVLVGDAPISMRTPDGTIVNLRTHGDGTALYYTKTVSGTSQTPNTFSVAAQVGTLRTETSFVGPTADATWTVKLSGVPTRAKEPALDIAFVVDCTGSMGDEISYLQAELSNVVKTVKTQHSMRRVRLGLVLYKDRGDDYVTKSFPFTEDLNTYLAQLKTAVAGGGGDMPESVNAALADTVNKLSWAGDETGRLAILVADAPPHYYADEQYTYKNAIVDLSARGVKLLTLGASGIDKTTEYLFREMSAFTGGRYIFLTDDSGVGDSHLTPDISGYQVEHLNKILIRAIGDEAKAFKR